MKKLSLFIVLFFVVISAFAGDNLIGLTKRAHRDKDVFDDGVFFHFGFGYPYQRYPKYGMVNLGVQGSFEFGTHFMFSKKNNVAFGATFSWAMAGISFRGDDNVDGLDLSFSLMRFGPLMSLKLDDTIALDLFFNASPSGRVNWFSVNSEYYSDFLYGILWVPGAKFRFNEFVIGGEVQFGNLFVDGREPGEEYYKTSYFNPRIFIGVKL